MSEGRYVMRLSLNVLNHMGLYLYSNTPAPADSAFSMTSRYVSTEKK